MKNFLLTSLSLFGGGFLTYSLTRYFFIEKQRNVSSSVLINILRKIQSFSIQILMHRYDKANKISNQIGNESSFEVSSVEQKEKEIEFDTETANMLLQIELGKIKDFDIKPNEYYNSLKSNINNKELVSIINTIKKTYNSLCERKAPEFQINDTLREKYLSIISNIFYFNLQVTVKEYYAMLDETSRKMSSMEKDSIFNSKYRTHLKKTRNKVLAFFGLSDIDQEIKYKLLLRIFPYYFNQNHPLRIQYKKISDDVNKLINYIVNSDEKVETFTDEKSPLYYNDCVDKIIFFDVYMENVKDSKMLEKNKGEVNYEDQID